MSLSFPSDHRPRFDNFEIDGILDETLREGSERCMFSVETEDKIPLLKSILNTGIKDVIFGSGPQDPADMATVIDQLLAAGHITNQQFSHILLLNCFEPQMELFAAIPADVKKYITISFGMVMHGAEHNLFERTVERFRALGYDNYRVSLLNSFSASIGEADYARIVRQIEMSVRSGIETVRINDSLGTLYPEAMAVLAANLRHDFPNVRFCLHAHNDRGLGLQNALTSIYHGFDFIEGGFAGFGNRSGLPAIELLDLILAEKNIRLKSGPLDRARVRETARLAEETFLVVPDLFRPVTGAIVDCENMGVANIPDYLGADRVSTHFLNRIGLHEETVRGVLKASEPADEADIAAFTAFLTHRMRQQTDRKRVEYSVICDMIERLYRDHVFFEPHLQAALRAYRDLSVDTRQVA